MLHPQSRHPIPELLDILLKMFVCVMDGRQEVIVLHVLQVQGPSSSLKPPELDNDWTTAINIRFQQTQAVDNILSAGRHGGEAFCICIRDGIYCEVLPIGP